MIQFLRVEHRLLHGQVAVSWFNALDLNTILV
ncbi:PTS sugar transporter subunit IIB, partial [Listeria monocytogenes]|nr:PTS sugar transporter subunit IIB [Listeria monocytogenes]